MNLFTKILVSVISTSLIIFVSVIGFNLYKSSNLAEENAKEIASAVSEKHAKMIEAELDYTMDTARSLASAFGALVAENKTDRDLANAMLKKALEENEKFLGTFTVWEPNAFDGRDADFVNKSGHDETGRFIPYWNRSEGEIRSEAIVDYDEPGAGDFYLLAKNSGEEVILEPYSYQTENGEDMLMTSAVAPIKMDGEVVGVAGVDISLDYLQEINDSLKLYESGFGAIVSNKGTFLAHKENKLVGTSNYEIEGSNAATEIKATIESGKSLSTIDFSPVTQGDVYKAYSPINVGSSNTPWSSLVTIPVDEVNQKSNELLTLSIIIGTIGIIILVAVIFWITRKLVKPILKVVGQMKEIASGNLTVEKLDIKSKDEIGQLANATNQMLNGLKDMIHNISTASESMTSQSEELTQSANDVRSGSEQIASTMQELSSGAESQANYASDLSSIMGAFRSDTQEANANGEHIHMSSSQVLKLTGVGSRLMELSTEQMEKIDWIVQNAVHKVQELDNQSQEISKLIAVIKDIADQTNLLALNAAIEAARAGEQGKGFAVVADEVRKLAEQVSESVTDITGIVESIQNETSMVTDSLQGGYKEVQDGTSQIKTTSDTFKRISIAVTEMADQIKMVSENLTTISENSEKMNDSIQEIAAISEESAAGIEQTTASSQQTSSSMEEVAESSNELAKLAENLSGLVQQFKI